MDPDKGKNCEIPLQQKKIQQTFKVNLTFSIPASPGYFFRVKNIPYNLPEKKKLLPVQLLLTKDTSD